MSQILYKVPTIRKNGVKVQWAIKLEKRYREQMRYEWIDKMPDINSNLRNFYHSNMTETENGRIRSELFWTSRRSDAFGDSFSRARENFREIERNTSMSGISCSKFSHGDMLLTEPYKKKSTCSDCADESDEIFVFRTVNGYRKSVTLRSIY